jgi:type IV pilus assembly protein PilM
VFTKDSSIGGRNLASEIQKYLNLTYSDAETLKISGHTNGMPQEVSELMHVMAENLSSEIKRALDFYNASSTGAPISYVLLAGGSAKIPNLSRIVEEALGLPCQIINPFNAVSYDPAIFTPEYVSAIAPIASVPIGLAIRAGVK